MILSRLLSRGFAGRRARIAAQLGARMVIDHARGIELTIEIAAAAEVVTRLPVADERLDEDDIPISIMLFVTDGFVSEPEFLNQT
jgi:hypothetical protein